MRTGEGKMRKTITGVVPILLMGILLCAMIPSHIRGEQFSRSSNSKESGLLDFNTSIISGEEKIDSVIWNNYGLTNSSDGMASQWDDSYPFQCQVGDDFLPSSDFYVTGVHWWGCFFNGELPWPNPSDFNIIFYADDGTGYMPTGAGMEDPTPTALAVYHIPQVNETPVDPDNPFNVWFEYNTSLPAPFSVVADTKYWIAIQANVSWPPQWGWGRNGYENPEQLLGPVQGFPLMQVPYWTDISYGGDMAFILYGRLRVPPLPPVIYGPSDGVINVEYSFWTDPVTDPEGDVLYCRWDWGDGNVTDWLGPYSSGSIVYASHAWQDAGIYDIRAQLKGTDGESNWSEPHIITIVQGGPPSTPWIDGPSPGKPRITYTYEFNATVSVGDTILYFIDWGDNTNSGWIGPYLSGEVENANHSWAKRGTYPIKIKAKDGLGQESAWGTLPVKIPKTYTIPFLKFWERIFERFPHAFPLLRFLLTF
jgi:hypothetical protein